MQQIDSVRGAFHDTVAVSDTNYAVDSFSTPLFSESVLMNGAKSMNGAASFSDFLTAANPDWHFFFLIGLLLLIAWTRNHYGNIMIKSFQASVNFADTGRLFNDNSVLQKQMDNILYVVYFLSIGFFLLLMEYKFGLFPYGFSGINLLLFNISVLLIFFFGRLILSGLTGYIFKQKSLLKEYTYNIFVYCKLAGVIIIVFLLFITYTDGNLRNIIEWTALVVIILVFLLRIYRSILFSVKRRVFIFYLFLYLCALEIAPIMAMFKWVQSII